MEVSEVRDDLGMDPRVPEIRFYYTHPRHVCHDSNTKKTHNNKYTFLLLTVSQAIEVPKCCASPLERPRIDVRSKCGRQCGYMYKEPDDILQHSIHQHSLKWPLFAVGHQWIRPQNIHVLQRLPRGVMTLALGYRLSKTPIRRFVVAFSVLTELSRHSRYCRVSRALVNIGNGSSLSRQETGSRGITS